MTPDEYRKIRDEEIEASNIRWCKAIFYVFGFFGVLMTLSIIHCIWIGGCK